jgi:hypothetical protein
LSIPKKVFLFIENDMFVEIDELHDGLDALTYFNAATVTATLKDRDSNVITGVNGITLTYVVASNGKYRGPIQETFNPTLGGGYKLEIVAVQGGVQGKWVIPAEVKIRTGNNE